MCRRKMDKQAFVYIMTNKQNGTLYVGAATNLVKRVWEHKHHVVEGFTKKYRVDIDSGMRRNDGNKPFRKTSPTPLSNEQPV